MPDSTPSEIELTHEAVSEFDPKDATLDVLDIDDACQTSHARGLLERLDR